MKWERKSFSAILQHETSPRRLKEALACLHFMKWLILFHIFGGNLIYAPVVSSVEIEELQCISQTQDRLHATKTWIRCKRYWMSNGIIWFSMREQVTACADVTLIHQTYKEKQLFICQALTKIDATIVCPTILPVFYFGKNGIRTAEWPGAVLFFPKGQR